MTQKKSFKIGTGTIVLTVFSIIVTGGVWGIVDRWDEANSDEFDPASTHPHTFTYSPDENSVWMGTHTGIYELSDGKWRRAVEDLRDNDIMGLEINSSDPNKIVASGHGFIAGTSDGGGAWTAFENGVPNQPKPNVPDAHLLTTDPNNPEHLFVFINQEGDNVYESLDGGRTWSVAGEVSAGAYTIAVPANRPVNENSLLVGTEEGLFLYRLGTELNSTETLNSEPTYGLLTRVNGEIISLTESGMYRSVDGKDWSPMDLELKDEMPLGIKASKQNPNQLLIVTNQFTAYESTDNGQTWNPLN
ncbi:hypothetical protein FE782_21995 [Paenibacillus antri]|uniref:Photosynthesis system II assembly factor Ycf48/Hcf136-like domain-containing protein n=1 Tax=Paenibacillus antri TaxID=2582848 RepID=A0A5R9GBB7_9BACL|nr:hypothetical protein [Paenibacillus antri]TLS50013.1 hypothetical protein FE782_21995 [Paenibacillus antri]